MGIINKLLIFDLLKNKQYQCRHLFDMITLLMDKNIPGFLNETIRKFIRDVRKRNIIEEN